MLCPSHIGDLAGSDAHSSSSASNIEDTGNASSTLTVDANADAPSPPATSPALIGFRYVWTVRVNERKLSAEESVILHVSPKIATVHDHVSFQWNLRIHGTSGRLNSDDEENEADDDTPISYVAVELYFVDGPVNQVDVKAVVGIMPKESSEASHNKTIVEERKSLKMQRGHGRELTDTDRAEVSDYIKNNVGKQITLSVIIKMDSRLFDPYTYLNQIPSSYGTGTARVYQSRQTSSEGLSEGGDSDDEQPSFECNEEDKENVHDLLANMYFNRICLPQMEYVEDFVDLLIDAELNDLPVLKRACERYLCGELNTKKDLLTSLILDLLFISIVFNLNVMKSMTLSELSQRTPELKEPEKLLEEDEYKQLDKRIRSLSDRSLLELIEQCIAFSDQRKRVQLIC